MPESAAASCSLLTLLSHWLVQVTATALQDAVAATAAASAAAPVLATTVLTTAQSVLITNTSGNSVHTEG